MCGRVVQASGPDQLGLRVVNSFEGRDRRGGNVPPRYNAAPSQELWGIRQNRETGERSLDLLKWGLVPYWSKVKPKPPPIQRQGGDRPQAADVSGRLREAPLHPAHRRVLRVEGDPWAKGEAAVRDRDEG